MSSSPLSAVPAGTHNTPPDSASVLVSELIRFARRLLSDLVAHTASTGAGAGTSTAALPHGTSQAAAEVEAAEAMAAARYGYMLLTQLCNEIQYLGSHTIFGHSVWAATSAFDLALELLDAERGAEVKKAAEEQRPGAAAKQLGGKQGVTEQTTHLDATLLVSGLHQLVFPRGPPLPSDSTWRTITLDNIGDLSKAIIEMLLKNIGKLPQFVQLLYDQAVGDPAHAATYAKLCRRLVDAKKEHLLGVGLKDEKTGQVSMVPLVKDFRKNLLNVCQREFEAASRAVDVDEADELPADEDRILLAVAEEAAANQRHMLSSIKFVGELFKEDIVPAKIINSCINHLIPNTDVKEASLESLCTLFDTAGHKLEMDLGKSKAHATPEQGGVPKTKTGLAFPKGLSFLGAPALSDKPWAKMERAMQREGLSPRVKLVIADLLDLRQRGWKRVKRPEKTKPAPALEPASESRGVPEAEEGLCEVVSADSVATAPLAGK